MPAEPRLALKFLDSGAKGPYSKYSWPVPNGKPGAWVKAKGDLVACGNGIHACTLEQAFEWLQDECYVIELGGKVLVESEKLVARSGRLVDRVENWNDKTARLFAADCAKHVLPIFEKKHPKDDRPRKAIRAARDYAHGRLGAAARAAARAAAGAAAGDAAWDAERSWQTKRLARYLGKDVVASLSEFK